MLARRLTAIAAALALSFAAAAQEVSDPPDSLRIPNWAAPPFWMPQRTAISKEVAAGDEPGLAPKAVEGVPTPALAFTGITPCRIVDTRGNGFTGDYGPPSLIAGVPRSFTLTGQCGIPGGAEAVSLNVTVTNTQGPGHIVIYPQGGVQPTVSTLNYVAGQTIANAAVVPLGAGGGITVVAGVSDTDLILDTNGYYAPQVVVSTVNGLSGAVALAAGTNISITPSGNTLTIANAAAPGWSLTGNAGTTPGTNFLGTTDNQALELKVNGERSFRLEPHPTTPNVIGGSQFNFVTAGAFGATVSGGGTLPLQNRVTDDYGTVSGGLNNRAGDGDATTDDKPYAFVGGGLSNTASGFNSVVAGGNANTASGSTSFVGSGDGNVASGSESVVGGGNSNTAGPGGHTTVGGGFANSADATGATVAGGTGNHAFNSFATVGGGTSNLAGNRATVPGGDDNTAAGDYSFAAGRQARANHAGAFVWGDSTAADVASTAVNQFIVRSSGGATFYSNSGLTTGVTLAAGGGSWSMLSDRHVKENFRPVDRRTALERLAAIPIQTWNYESQSASIRHMGPMAQDFHAAFGLGEDDRHITAIDADGVALAAIQALYEIVKEKDTEIEALKARLSKLEATIE